MIMRHRSGISSRENNCGAAGARQSVPCPMQDPTFVQKAFAAIAPRYVLANHVLSGGIDVLWRRKVAALARERRPSRVLDLATGSGDLAVAVGAACPEAVVVAADFCAPMMEHAQRRGLARLVVADGMALPFADGAFDLVTVGFGLRNMADYGGAVREMARVLRPGGTLMVLDFSQPAPWLRGAYKFYLHRVLPAVAGVLTGQRGAYEYLGNSIEGFPSGPAMTAHLDAHGFHASRWIPLTGGIASLYVADKAVDGDR
jgi:demethylmenaquinone methyltransferase/2-methoxy-6-polyprenyl-1,4-benzoquinol methylase